MNLIRICRQSLSPILSAGAALILIFAPGLATPALAQQSAEQKKLEYFVGTWTTEVEIKASPSSGGGKGNGTETCEWFARAHVVCRAELSSAAGLYTSMRTISYVPALKQYSMYTVDSLGFAVLALGGVQGSTWTFTTDLGTMKTRSTIKTGGDSYSLTAEFAGADGKWATTSTGKATRKK